MIVVGAPIAKCEDADSNCCDLSGREADPADQAAGDEGRDDDEQHLAGTERYPCRVDAQPNEVHHGQCDAQPARATAEDDENETPVAGKRARARREPAQVQATAAAP